jgi:Holliday junction resolvase RusA-like endonuclease
MPTLAIAVHGVPQVQGNHRIVHQGLHSKIRDANPNLPEWRQKITWLARAERVRRRQAPWRGPVALEVTFWVDRPQSAPRTMDIWPTTRGSGDWDKLSRAIGDALVDAEAIVDDSQICEAHVYKRYAVGPDLPRIYVRDVHWERPGAQIRLRQLDEEAE